MKLLSNLKKKDLAGKTCLLRIDLNIKDTDLYGFKRINADKIPFRIQAVLLTIKFLVKNGARVVLLSHRGRPKINQQPLTNNQQLSLKPFAKIFEKLLKEKVEFIGFDENSSKTSWKLEMLKMQSAINMADIGGQNKKKTGKIFLVENLRFFEGEEKNDTKFAKELANFGDIYVNDAFAVSHRDNASVEAITKYLPSYAGLLLEKEIKNLDKAVKSSKHPSIVIMGGAKISDKIGLIDKFKNKADYFLIGGGIANNFLKAQGLPIGDSLFEPDKVDYAKKLLKNPKIILPVDYAVEERKILDIGPNTVMLYSDIIKKAKTIIWNGPMGHAEDKKFQKASIGLVKAVIKSKAFVVVGGGETASIFNQQPTTNNQQRRIFVSTGGGAMLEYLSGKNLPGLKALK